MSPPIDFPRFDVVLPALAGFIRELSEKIDSGEVDSGLKAERVIDSFFTREQIGKLEKVAPGWSKLIDYDARKTLHHVVTAMASLPFYPEYRKASESRQTILTWAVLNHDIGKRAKFERDRGHAFRSAVVTARNLPLTGVELPADYQTMIDRWSSLTLEAAQHRTKDGVQVDNKRLPRILHQLDKMLGEKSSSNRIIKIILLHHSINILKDWPQSDPLTEAEVLRLVDRELLQILRIMMLADNDGWELFHAQHCPAYRSETRAVFDHLEKEQRTKMPSPGAG